MSLTEKLFIAIVISLFIGIYLLTNQLDKINGENAELTKSLVQQSLIIDNAYTSISIFDRISGVAIDAKQQNTLDAQGTKKDVKTILVGNDCAPVAVPDSLIDRMRQYKD
ncbi:hypothetical protein MNY66_06005 [Moellerella wisconsensis]|uniref:hypothetical protein n=1 Tax=Moellerella wisconsensis TaxID=158849 RepID=UPI001F4DCE70|nr:hypothetical protein [Moellerella wisconsensis]UNH43525.1 hypothetical protein MNY66_06005 [Moellerella wisconsensis]